MKVYPSRDIRPFVMYCVNGKPRSSLLIESTDSMISRHEPGFPLTQYITNGGISRAGYTIIESVDSISRDERGFPLTQYITNGRISRDGYTITHFKHYYRVLRLIFYRMSI